MEVGRRWLSSGGEVTSRFPRVAKVWILGTGCQGLIGRLGSREFSGEGRFSRQFSQDKEERVSCDSR